MRLLFEDLRSIVRAVYWLGLSLQLHVFRANLCFCRSQDSNPATIETVNEVLSSKPKQKKKTVVELKNERSVSSFSV